MLLATWPHLVNAVRSGDAGYVADGDALLYLAWSRDVVRHGEWSMTDAVHRPSGPMMHPWALFVPEGLLAHALGLGMTGLGLIWRALGGAGLAMGLYAVVRPFAKSPRGAAGLAAFLLFDAGFLLGQVGQRDLEIIKAIAFHSGNFFASVPRIMAHLRVPTPALAIPFLLIHFALTHRARRLGTTGSAVAAGVSLGLLFSTYFYFATTAFAATVLAWLVDRDGRRTYAWIFGVGLVVAAPSLIASAWIKAQTPPDWLHRTDKFVPIQRFDRARLLLPKLLIAEWLASAWIVFRSRRELRYLWLYTGAGLAMANHHVITGLNLENFHWTYAYGVSFSVLLALIVTPWLARLRGGFVVATVVVIVQIMAGFGLRDVEVRRSAETNIYRDLWARWKDERIAIPPRSVVAGPTDLLFCLAAMEEVDPLDCRLVEYSSVATDVERDERLVLNAILIGADREATINEGERPTEISKSRRRLLFDRMTIEVASWTRRFGVTYVLLPAGRMPPTSLSRAGDPLTEGAVWTLWRLKPTIAPSSPEPRSMIR